MVDILPLSMLVLGIVLLVSPAIWLILDVFRGSSRNL